MDSLPEAQLGVGDAPRSYNGTRSCWRQEPYSGASSCPSRGWGGWKRGRCGPFGRWQQQRSVPLDVVEDDKSFTVMADIPGFDKKDVKVTLADDGTLTISGERNKEQATAAAAAQLDLMKAAPPAAAAAAGSVATPAPYSRRYTSFVRSFMLPERADRAAIRASTENGVLTVTVPKAAEPLPQVKEIPVM